ncbi:tRNA modification GTPase trmE [Desulfonispora thiosulfatigenes DSM 11270]|uniref:tRNA modification GTPase MnmE n=1 Tax=Desulfonispora thiosulfatigenes DSM 11270 TaxID=656914 RepID=A0A1W1V3C1_DESTI|nr:tRNA modification GTPase trmE [Desulfonispora thiosulfatigenes DSM 11270]
MINDTIAAIITAYGKASVGIIRISGSDALEIGNKIYKGHKDLKRAENHTINYGKVYDNYTDKIIDEALFLVMLAPKSFTGEDVIEIQCHGGVVVVKKILELVLRNGARMADAGEFSKRAFLNGKLDLAQAEAIIEIIEAKTDKSLSLAVNQLEGNLSALIKKVRVDLLSLMAFIEADIDFPEEDIERLTIEQQLELLLGIEHEITNILKTAKGGKIIREGLNIVIIGKPNVGKSSLLNALVKENRAIVTDIPGTTRDIIEEYINLGGIPIKVIDTAGIRETEDIVEKLGVDKAKDLINRADLVLFVIDSERKISEEDKDIISLLQDKETIMLVNKVDLGVKDEFLKELKDLSQKPIIQISAKENIGLEDLEKNIIDLFFDGDIESNDQVLVSSTRHIDALERADDHLKGAINSIEAQLPGDFITIDVQGAFESLGKVTGETIEEDILDQIFSQFCIGK